MHDQIYLFMHHTHAAELRAEAAAHRFTARVSPPQQFRARLGWTLVAIGLHLISSR
ncbi:hypothetical protein ACFWF9_33290 [Streptomyces roseolus]|uniref:hypothetical protein n=1 Tax=Streptomyces roseolus TaxID=67358 RepID=UPI003664EB30